MNEPLEPINRSAYIPSASGDVLQDILNTLEDQNRFLLDLLAAINGLTALLLSQQR